MPNPAPGSPRPETPLIGFLFVLFLAPLLAVNAWFAITVVSKLGSTLSSLGFLVFVALLIMGIAGFLMRLLLNLPIKRCLREAFAAGWAFAAPSLFVYYWNLPLNKRPLHLVVFGIGFLLWIVFFIKVFAANSAKAKAKE